MLARKGMGRSMSKLSKNQLDIITKTIMPELYEIQGRWDAWDEALDSIAAESVKLKDIEKQDEEGKHESE